MYTNTPAPITSSSFNRCVLQCPACCLVKHDLTAFELHRDGSIYAYSLSYDWGRGYSDYQPAQMKSTILLHATKDDEVKAKPKLPSAAPQTGRR